MAQFCPSLKLLLSHSIVSCVHFYVQQSAVTIYIPYDGVVKELMYEVNDIATKGKPLMLIEVEGDVETDGNW